MAFCFKATITSGDGDRNKRQTLLPALLVGRTLGPAVLPIGTNHRPATGRPERRERTSRGGLPRMARKADHPEVSARGRQDAGTNIAYNFRREAPARRFSSRASPLGEGSANRVPRYLEQIVEFDLASCQRFTAIPASAKITIPHSRPRQIGTKPILDNLDVHGTNSPCLSRTASR